MQKVFAIPIQYQELVLPLWRIIFWNENYGHTRTNTEDIIIKWLLLGITIHFKIYFTRDIADII